MIKDLQGYTFQLCNIFPPANYVSTPPLYNYQFVVENSGMGAVYAGVDQRTVPYIIALPSFFDAANTDLIGSSTGFAPAPQPQMWWQGGGMGVPTGDEKLNFMGADYVFVANDLPGISAEHSGFLNWEVGFGFATQTSHIYYHDGSGAIFFIGNGPLVISDYDYGDSWLADTRIDGVEEDTVLGWSLFQANMENVKQHYRTLNGQTYNTFFVHGQVRYTNDNTGTPATSFDDYSQQYLVHCHVNCQQGDFSYSRIYESMMSNDLLPAGWTVDGIDLYDFGGSKSWLCPYPNAVSRVSTTSVDSDLRFFDGTISTWYGSQPPITDNIKKRFPNKETINAQSTEFVSARLSILRSMIGRTLEVPKEYRARKQTAPAIMKATLSAVGESYISEETGARMLSVAPSATPGGTY